MAITPNTNFSVGQVLTSTQANNFPRGLMGYQSRTAGGFVFNAAAAADLTGMSITFTAEANRLYQASWNIAGQKQTNAGFIQMFLTNAANTTLASCITSQVAAGYFNLSSSAVVSFSAGSQTLKLRAEVSTNSAFFYSDNGFPMIFSVTDIGGI